MAETNRTDEVNDLRSIHVARGQLAGMPTRRHKNSTRRRVKSPTDQVADVDINSGVNVIQNLGGHQGKA